jgi:uncharacterized iron-regulated membrane protein
MTGEEKFYLFIIAAGVFILAVTGFSAVFEHMREVSKHRDT